MHVWEGSPPLASGTPYGSFDIPVAPADTDCALRVGAEGVGLRQGISGSLPGEPEQWHATAVVALGVLLGVPFLATGTLQGAWVQISEAFTDLRR